jgi:hypothetical protein
MDASTDRPHSPSARFYAYRRAQCHEVCHTLSHPAPEAESPYQLVAPFSHFQGFSAPASSYGCNNSCAGRLSDERLSPRTVIPRHNCQIWELPGLRLGQLADENGQMIPTTYRAEPYDLNDLGHTYQSHHGVERARELTEPPTCRTPPPLYQSSPETAPALADRPVSMMFSAQAAPTGPLPVPVRHHNTSHVPTYGQASDSGQQSLHLIHARHTLAAKEQNRLAPISGEEDDTSTVYPYDSTTRSSSSMAFPSTHDRGAQPKPLEEALVEIHDTCLAATQRYLESLHVNWELRQGHQVLSQPGLAGPTRRLRDRTYACGSPYSFPRRCRRALSDNSGLELMTGLRGSDYTGNIGGDGDGRLRGHGRQHARPTCPIPEPTNSLLQNTSHICELIWRKACRDREDVLGAEAAGARKMGLLFECAEAMILYDAAEWEGDPEKGFYTACRAGREFCRELGDSDGARRVQDIERAAMSRA